MAEAAPRVTLVPAERGDIPLVQDMARFYVYDIARQIGPDPDWAPGRDWLYTCQDLSPAFDAGNHPFLIEADGGLAGFCLVDHMALVDGIHWNMGQFFVLGPLAGQGIGQAAARQAFDRFPGRWQVSQIPANRHAVLFWRRLIEGYTAGRFEELTVPDPGWEGAPRNVMVFTSPPPSTESPR